MKYLLLVLLLWAPNAWGAERILALSPHACEMLYAIGAARQVVGAVSWCDYPQAAAKLPRVGSYEHINVEAALRLKPDLAIVVNRHVSGIDTLEKMGVRIVVSNPDSFESIFSDMLKLGQLTSHPHEAENIVTGLRARLDKVRAQPRSGTAVFYEVWSDPLLTAGGPGFISDMIHQAGGRNVFANLAVETPHVNVEAVIRARPELIVIPLEKRDISVRRAFWEKWLGKNSVRFVAINPDLLHRPGPRLLDGLELLQKALNGTTDGHR
ncbi:cobalamin-binding protein [Mariprofundus erugo]|uniref:cobalamin-binding protein n=1 Tax=Mariprofundus erugo TaxID=2528639 RepID=UPI0010FE130F|nr:cobalamin-binding protein [Mariprofundus erugo]TLS77569.1 cobalamin-binding protein [Mariprofundus erugo]